MTSHELIREATRLARDGLLGAAADLLSGAVDSKPEDVLLLRALGRIRLLQNRPAEAVDLLHRALKSIQRDSTESPLRAPNQGNTEQATIVEAPQVAIGPTSDLDYAAHIEREILAERQYETGADRASSVARVDGSDFGGNEARTLVEVRAEEDVQPAIEDVLETDQPFAESAESELDADADSSLSDQTEQVSTSIAAAEYEPQADDFCEMAAQELPTREELNNIPSRITREDKARKVAIEVAEKFGWDRKGVDVLTSLFVKHWWGASRSALERAIEGGADRRDIAVADQVRESWESCPEFASFVNYQGEVSHRYSVLPWPTALQLVRSFASYPDASEVEHFLMESYEFWFRSSELVARFNSFYSFLRYILNQASESQGTAPWLRFSQEEALPDICTHHAVLSELESWGVYIKGEVFTKGREAPKKSQSDDEASGETVGEEVQIDEPLSQSELHLE
jgi:hypothetical protein